MRKILSWSCFILCPREATRFAQRCARRSSWLVTALCDFVLVSFELWALLQGDYGPAGPLSGYEQRPRAGSKQQMALCSPIDPAQERAAAAVYDTVTSTVRSCLLTSSAPQTAEPGPRAFAQRMSSYPRNSLWCPAFSPTLEKRCTTCMTLRRRAPPAHLKPPPASATECAFARSRRPYVTRFWAAP